MSIFACSCDAARRDANCSLFYRAVFGRGRGRREGLEVGAVAHQVSTLLLEGRLTLYLGTVVAYQVSSFLLKGVLNFL